jgi:hypothetical protein
LLVEGFELGLGQFVFLGRVAEARLAQLPEKALAPAVGALHLLLEVLHRALEAVLAQDRQARLQGFVPGAWRTPGSATGWAAAVCRWGDLGGDPGAGLGVGERGAVVERAR